jgi:FG-GAP-like repeat/ASPIC and UnbV
MNRLPAFASLILAFVAARGSAGPSPDGPGPLFQRVAVPPISDIREGMNGVALADFDHDGRVDVVAIYAEPEVLPRTGRGTQLRVFLNQGHFRFRPQQVEIQSRELSAERFGARAQVPVLADFNRDGFLDLLVTRSAPMAAGNLLRNATPLGNTLLVSRQRWNQFTELSAPMGIRNELAYNRQSALGDVNRDGWLDIAVGADNIGNANWGLPISRLYVFQPRGPRFEHGTFQDIGGTALVPDFGGFDRDPDRDKAGPDINLTDLDNDSDLDLLQSYHVDCREPGLPYSPCEYRQGMFVWRNMLAETGRLHFKSVTDNGLAEVGKLRYNASRRVYEPVLVGSGLPYVSLADVNSDALLDVVAVGPSDPGWSPRAEYVGGRFWYNLGAFRFERATDAAGLAALNWTYRQWDRFLGLPVRAVRGTDGGRGPTVAQPGLARSNPLDGRPYYADAVFADVDNDGWVDLIVPDRSGRASVETRALLFMNQGDGRFAPMPLSFSGLDSGAIGAEAADIDNDGLVDLIFSADPDNSGTTRSLDQYETRIYRNTGRYGAAGNHWLRMRFTGVYDAALIGARVEVRAPGSSRVLGTRVIASKQNYKSGSSLEAHYGLGANTIVDAVVILPGGRTVRFRAFAQTGT